MKGIKIMNKEFFNFSYGLFLVTSKYENKETGCIINTATQVSENPNTITITINKNAFTHELISKSKKLTLSILTEKVPYSIIELYGYKSGRDINKFEDTKYLKKSNNDNYYLNEYTNSIFSGKVINEISTNTHTIFIVEVEEIIKTSTDKSVTYKYYIDTIKPKVTKENTGNKKVWVCKICNYIYDDNKEEIPFEELPDDYLCPLCIHPKSDFEELK